jgi:hypothetical protein
VIARYKAHMLSTSSSATGPSSQRKVALVSASPLMKFAAAYESGGDVFYVFSDDVGSWQSEVLVSSGEGKSKNPSVESLVLPTSQRVSYIVWEENPYNTSGYRIWSRTKNETTGSWGAATLVYENPSVRPSAAYPVVSGGYVFWKGHDSNNGIMYRIIDASKDVGVVPNTNASSNYPAVEIAGEHVSIAWEQTGSGIRYYRAKLYSGSSTGISFAWATLVTVVDNSGSTNTKPTVVNMWGHSASFDTACVAWECNTSGQGSIKFRKIDLSNNLSPITTFSATCSGYPYGPMLTQYRDAGWFVHNNLFLGWYTSSGFCAGAYYQGASDPYYSGDTWQAPFIIVSPGQYLSTCVSSPGVGSDLAVATGPIVSSLYSIVNVNLPSQSLSPASPGQNSPTNGQQNVALGAAVSWNCSYGASSYRVQVATDSTFGTGMVNDQTGITGTSFATSANSYNHIYYWRVNATSGNGTGSWSTTWHFTTQPLPSPALLSPSNGATGQSVTPTLSWSSSSGATSYELLVAYNLQFTNIFYDYTNRTATSQLVGTLNHSTTYYWKVRSSDGPDTSNWSSPWHFTTGAPPPPPPPGCPYVFTWNGERFEADNNILPQAEYTENHDKDVTDYYQLQNPPLVSSAGRYEVEVSEFERERSSLDQFQLLVIDHSEESQVAVLADGSIRQFTTPFELGKITSTDAELSSDSIANLARFDGRAVQLSDGSHLRLHFVPTENAPLAQGKITGGLLVGGWTSHRTTSLYQKICCDQKVSVHTEVEEPEVVTHSTAFSFREKRSLLYIPLDSLALDLDIEIAHEAAYDYATIGVDVAPPDYTVQVLTPNEAVHSQQGGVQSLVAEADGQSVSLVPGETIRLEFPVPKQTGNTDRSFVLVSTGRYERIKPQIVETPGQYRLSQNHPNPFNPTTQLEYALPVDARVTLKVFDVLGHEVETLVEQDEPVGYKTVSFDASRLPSGVYYYRLTAIPTNGKPSDGFTDTKRMLLMK